MANFNSDITVTLLSNAPGVATSTFSTHLLLTDQPTFSEKYREYESNNAVQQDSTLDSAAKAAGAIFFSQQPPGQRLRIGKVTYESAGGELKTSLGDIKAADGGFYTISCMSRAKANQQAMAEWAASNDRLAFVQSSDSDILSATGGNLFETLKNASNSRACGLYHAADGEYADVAWASHACSIDLDATSGVLYDRQLSGCGIQDANVSDSQKSTILSYNGNIYLTLLSVGATGPGKVFGGDWIDEVMRKDWTKARITEAVAQLKLNLAKRNQKIPYTNHGLAMIAACIRGVTRRAEQIGAFVEGETIINVPDISDVSASDLAARTARIYVTARLTGGIKDFNISVAVLNS